MHASLLMPTPWCTPASVLDSQGALIFPDMDALEGLLAERQGGGAGSGSVASEGARAGSGNGSNGVHSGHPLVSQASARELEDLYMTEVQRLEEERCVRVSPQAGAGLEGTYCYPSDPDGYGSATRMWWAQT